MPQHTIREVRFCPTITHAIVDAHVALVDDHVALVDTHMEHSVVEHVEIIVDAHREPIVDTYVEIGVATHMRPNSLFQPLRPPLVLSTVPNSKVEWSGVKKVSREQEENTGHENIEHEPIGEKKESCVLKENIMHEKSEHALSDKQHLHLSFPLGKDLCVYKSEKCEPKSEKK